MKLSSNATSFPEGAGKRFWEKVKDESVQRVDGNRVPGGGQGRGGSRVSGRADQVSEIAKFPRGRAASIQGKV